MQQKQIGQEKNILYCASLLYYPVQAYSSFQPFFSLLTQGDIVMKSETMLLLVEYYSSARFFRTGPVSAVVSPICSSSYWEREHGNAKNIPPSKYHNNITQAKKRAEKHYNLNSKSLFFSHRKRFMFLCFQNIFWRNYSLPAMLFLMLLDCRLQYAFFGAHHTAILTIATILIL